MESKWRQNIEYCGMCESNWRLCARFVDDPSFFCVAIAPFGGPRYQVWQDLGPGQLPQFIGNFLIAPLGSHFPYGNDVEPDA